MLSSPRKYNKFNAKRVSHISYRAMHIINDLQLTIHDLCSTFHEPMPKIKTKKSVIKKIKITKNKKVLRRSSGQNHFNSKETGKVGREKKGDKRLFKADEHNVLKALPYAK